MSTLEWNLFYCCMSEFIWVVFFSKRQWSWGALILFIYALLTQDWHGI